jgi:hypothetical protein
MSNPDAGPKPMDYKAGSSDYPITGRGPLTRPTEEKARYGKAKTFEANNFSGIVAPTTEKFVPTEEIPDTNLSPEDLVMAKEKFIALKSNPANQKVDDGELWEQAVAEINADEEKN